MQAAKKGTMFVIYAISTTKSINGVVALPIHFKWYQDVFEMKNADFLSQLNLYE
jgi:hypothetical protein